MNHNRTELRSINFSVTLSTILLLSPILAESSRVQPPPYAGINDQELEQLGPRALPKLLSMLKRSRNEQYYEGIVRRLPKFAQSSKAKKETTAALIIFINTHITQDRDIGNTAYALTSALGVVGEIADNEGIAYLKTWLTDPSQSAKVRCFRKARSNLEATRQLLLTCAGLAVESSPHPDALKILIESRRRPPILNKDFLIALDEMIGRKHSKIAN